MTDISADRTVLSGEEAQAPLFVDAPNGLLRFITCGSVDDGKSTLIGRLLYDSKLLLDDQVSALESASRRFGTTGEGNLDFALLVDGLQAEVEQGITIDVAYRFFATDKRKFIVADTPGHEQYTRNMVTGASTADLAVLLVDARQGVVTQTRRHAYIAALLGVKTVVMAVNKMDLVDYDELRFRQIRADFAALTSMLGLAASEAIPVSALVGDNISSASDNMRWYEGPSLLEFLENVPQNHSDFSQQPLRFPVQWVNRPHLDFRGFSGTVTAGQVAVGDPVVVLPSAKQSQVKQIVTFDGDLPKARAGQAITLVLEDEIDISRGDLICSLKQRAEVADQFQADLVWMDEKPLLPGRSYLLKLGSKTVAASITSIKHKVNVNTFEHTAAKTLALNEIAEVNLSLEKEVAFDPYEELRETGGFILIDRMTNATVGAGMLKFALRRSQNLHRQALNIEKQQRAQQKGQEARVLWFTGLSGSGKSTVANLVEQRLFAAGKHCMILDGDNVRHGLNRDLGFTDADRVENIRRIGEVAKLMVEAGLIVIVSFISPFRSERRMARELLQDGEFVEVFVDTPLEICEQRDVKGLYAKARSGQIKNFTGIDSPYEPPEAAELHLQAGDASAEELAQQVIAYLERSDQA